MQDRSWSGEGVGFRRLDGSYMTCTTILFIQYTRHNEKNSMQTRIPHTPPLLDNTSHGYALGHTNIFFVRQTSSEKRYVRASD